MSYGERWSWQDLNLQSHSDADALSSGPQDHVTIAAIMTGGSPLPEATLCAATLSAAMAGHPEDQAARKSHCLSQHEARLSLRKMTTEIRIPKVSPDLKAP